jgi:O-succinylbenzoic acid--CoA ligase
MPLKKKESRTSGSFQSFLDKESVEMLMEWLKKGCLEYPDKKFINEWTFLEVYDKTIKLAKKLAPLVKNEKRIALYASNSEKMAIYIFALLLLKKELLLLNIHLTEEDIKIQTEELNVSVILSSKGNFLSFEEIEKRPETSELSEIKTIHYFEAEDESIAFIMNTSATTGKFKSVPIRWKQIKAHVKASVEVLGVKEEDNWLVVLPLFHISGLSILFRSLYNKTRVTILNQFKEKEVLDYIFSKQVNMISLVPTMLARIYQNITEHNLRVILLGGEFIPARLVENCTRRGLPIYKTYGMTETTSQSTTVSVTDFPDKINSVGKPLPGVSIVIRNPNQSGIGEVWMKSPMLMKGYLGMEEIGDYFNTDDIGYLDEEGFLYLLNRRSDIIISGGENIYPKEIEDLLYQLSKVKECAVAGVPDEKWGQVPVLYLVSSLSEEEIRSYLLKNLAKYKVPKSIIYQKELPKNVSGKIQRKLLWRR